MLLELSAIIEQGAGTGLKKEGTGLKKEGSNLNIIIVLRPQLLYSGLQISP